MNLKDDVNFGFGKLILEHTAAGTPEIKQTLLEIVLSKLQDEGMIKDSDEKIRAMSALDEAIVNAIFHGNKKDPSKNIHIRLYTDNNRWGVCIEDEGDGFDYKKALKRKADDDKLSEHGRGIIIIMKQMDSVEYFDNGNKLFMTRDLS